MLSPGGPEVYTGATTIGKVALNGGPEVYTGATRIGKLAFSGGVQRFIQGHPQKRMLLYPGVPEGTIPLCNPKGRNEFESFAVK